MTLQLLHIADLHLDRPFVGLSPEQARVRRGALRDALDRALHVALDREVELITIGGDLWEEEHVLPDTCRWVADRLDAAGVPVAIVAGNHDPLRRDGAWERTSWPANVTLLGAGALHELALGELSVWGASWGAEPLSARFLEGFSVPEDGRSHLLLIHGTFVDASPVPARSTEGSSSALGERGGLHCPFSRESVRRAGFDLCLAGHLHGGGVREGMVVYPGSPEPLAWDETGRHALALVGIEREAAPRVELIDVNSRGVGRIEVDCEGACSSADLERALGSALEGVLRAREARPLRLSLRAVLLGRIAPDCDVDLERLASIEHGLELLELHDRTSPSFDLDALAAQTSALGAFVRGLRARIEATSPSGDSRRTLELALEMGLKAMHGDRLELSPSKAPAGRDERPASRAVCT